MTDKIREAWSGPGKKDGTITEFKPEYDAIHIDMNEKGNAEWWYFDAHLTNGYFVVVFFRAKHERTGKTGVEITIYDPEGKKVQNIYDYERTDLVVSKENANVKIGKNYIKVDNSNEQFPVYEIFLDEGEYGIHLTFKAKVKGWMPGKGFTEFGNKGHFGWVIALPKAEVTGTIRVKNKEMFVEGIGYHDHNWLNFQLPMVVDYWYWGRIYSDTFTIIFAYIKCNKKMDNYPIDVLMVAKDEEIIMSTGEYDLLAENFQFHEKANNRYPKSLKFTISEQQKITLEVEKIVDADNLLFEMGPLLRFVVKRVMRLKPGYFRLNSKFNLDFQYEGKTYKETGNALFEVVVSK